ncbi:MAG: hypothetical protein WCO29_11465 [Nostocales cyanobacterium ELA583]|jgi:hypothetical protein
MDNSENSKNTCGMWVTDNIFSVKLTPMSIAKPLQKPAAKEESEALVLQERQQKEKLAAYLKTLGINPDEIP